MNGLIISRSAFRHWPIYRSIRFGSVATRLDSFGFIECRRPHSCVFIGQPRPRGLSYFTHWFSVQPNRLALRKMLIFRLCHPNPKHIFCSRVVSPSFRLSFTLRRFFSNAIIRRFNLRLTPRIFIYLFSDYWHLRDVLVSLITGTFHSFTRTASASLPLYRSRPWMRRCFATGREIANELKSPPKSCVWAKFMHGCPTRVGDKKRQIGCLPLKMAPVYMPVAT